MYVLESRLVKNNQVTRFNLQDDLDILAAVIDQAGDVKLVNIDALTSYVGKVDNNSQSDIRQVFDPLSQFAEEKGSPFSGSCIHPRVRRPTPYAPSPAASPTFKSARLAFFVQKEQDTDRNLLLSVKNNLGPKAINRGYRIATKEISYGIIAPYVQWDDAPVDVTADEAMAQAAAARRGGSSMEDAKDFLRDLLDDEPVDAKTVLASAKQNGISERTLDRAKKALKIVSAKDEGSLDGAWKWRDLVMEGCQEGCQTLKLGTLQGCKGHLMYFFLKGAKHLDLSHGRVPTAQKAQGRVRTFAARGSRAA